MMVKTPVIQIDGANGGAHIIGDENFRVDKSGHILIHPDTCP